MTLQRPELEAFARRERDAYESLLREFVEVPSVSADPDRKPDIERVAELARPPSAASAAQAELLPRARRHARRAGRLRRRPRAAHGHRLQPPGRAAGLEGDGALATREPFVFTKKGDTYFGRGTTDDKGPALTALYGAKAALEAGRAREHPLPLGDRGGGRARRTSRRP